MEKQDRRFDRPESVVILDAATHRYLGTLRDTVYFKRRVEVEGALIVYAMIDKELGCQGKLSIQDRGAGTRIEIEVDDPAGVLFIGVDPTGKIVGGDVLDLTSEGRHRKAELRERCEARAQSFFESYQYYLIREFAGNEKTSIPTGQAQGDGTNQEAGGAAEEKPAVPTPDPQEPGEGASIEEWFEWRYQVVSKGMPVGWHYFKSKFPKVGYAEGTLRNKYSDWLEVQHPEATKAAKAAKKTDDEK